MKNFNINNVEITENIVADLLSVKESIKTFLSLSEKYKLSYFWSGNFGNAASRNRQARDDSFEFEKEIEELDFSIYLDFDLEISCKNVYVHKTVKINNKRTTARSFVKLLDEIDQILSLSEQLSA